MWGYFRRWLKAVPLHDPIAMRQAPLVQIMLICLICVTLPMLSFAFDGSKDPFVAKLDFLSLSLVFSGSISALIVYRRGHVGMATLLVLSALLMSLAINSLELGLRHGSEILSGLMLPIILAGFLAGRRGLLFTIPASIGIVVLTGVLEQRWPQIIGLATADDSSALLTIVGFTVIACLAGIFIDQFVSALRGALNDAIARERDLERSRASLEVRSAELSRAKEALEQELSIRKQVEAALIYERDLLHAFMDNIPDMIYFKDTDSRFIRINQAEAALLGLDDPEEAVGKTDFDFQPADLAQKFYLEERQIVETSQPLVDRVEFNPMPDGQPRWLSATKVPLIDKHGVVTGIIGVSRDITARQEVERLKSEFISIVSHELRTPLTSIRGSLGLLAGDAISGIPEPAKAMLDVAHRNTQRLILLINDLLDMEKIESGRLDFVWAPVELAPLLEHAIEANEAYGAQFGVTFVPTQLIPDAWVYVDSDRLMQVLTNLLSNAAKFSPATSEVYVALSRHQRMLRVSIADHGPGIPKAFQSRIFEKFAQADSSDARQKGGTGLGLSITKAIVERLGGEISYTTRIGAGTTFYIDLPEWHEEIGD